MIRRNSHPLLNVSDARASRNSKLEGLPVLENAVAMLVVGQLSRLELRSKVTNLVRPTEATGLRVDVFLSLNSNGTAYSRADAGQAGGG